MDVESVDLTSNMSIKNWIRSTRDSRGLQLAEPMEVDGFIERFNKTKKENCSLGFFFHVKLPWFVHWLFISEPMLDSPIHPNLLVRLLWFFDSRFERRSSFIFTARSKTSMKPWTPPLRWWRRRSGTRIERKIGRRKERGRGRKTGKKTGKKIGRKTGRKTGKGTGTRRGKKTGTRIRTGRGTGAVNWTTQRKLSPLTRTMRTSSSGTTSTAIRRTRPAVRRRPASTCCDSKPISNGSKPTCRFVYLNVTQSSFFTRRPSHVFIAARLFPLPPPHDLKRKSTNRSVFYQKESRTAQ